LTLLLPLAITAALAAGDQRPPGRFDDRIRHREGGAIGVQAKAIGRLDVDDELRVGWEAFNDRQDGPWRVFVDERTAMPTLAAGRGIEWARPDTVPLDLDRLELLGREFLGKNAALLGEWGALLELDRTASGRLGADHWQLVFRQVADGVRVENARLDLHVKQGKLVMFGASHWGTVETRSVPSLDAAEARGSLDAYLETAIAAFEQVGEPQLALIALAPDAGVNERTAWTGTRGKGLEHALIWRFSFREPGAAPLWVGEVDAHDGSIRAFFDGAHYASIRGAVFPISNDEDCATGGCEVVGFPMPFADVTETGQPEQFADTFGNLTCADPTATIETNLAGPYVFVNDTCGMLTETAVCGDGLDLGLKLGENCDVVPGGSPGNSAAARSAYYHLNRAAEVARFYDPANAWLQDQVTVNVNTGSGCNANWNGDINMQRAGNGCGNTGEQQGVLVHEWGHGYDHNDGGGVDVPGEAYADVVSIFASRTSCISRGWYNDGRTCTGYGDTCLTCTGIRDHDWAARQNNTPATPENFATFCPSGPGGPCGKEPHCEAYPIGETIFDLATRDLPAAGLDPDSAWQLAERLWYSTRQSSGGDVYNCFRTWLAHSCFATHWYQRMLVADDDDADLSNGTPHAAALFAAFDRHEIACGNASDPENQSTSSCPAIAAPGLSLVEIPSGTELSWAAVAGAGEIRVYRGDLGCDRQQVAIASLAGSATSYLDSVADPELPRYYRVEALGANPACHSPVSNCETTPLEARVQPYSFRVEEAGPDINGIPDPGETVKLAVTAFNSGLSSSTATTGTLQFVDPAQGNVLDGQTTWGDVAASGTLESDDPHFELTVFESVACGDTVSFEVDTRAANSTTTRRRFDIQLGEPERDFTNDVPETIPNETLSPVTSTIVVDQDETISEVDVSISITHDLATELIVELTSPGGTTVRLHDRSTSTSSVSLTVRYDLESDPDGPGTMQDFAGESTQGAWTLSVEDVDALSTGDGTLNDWTLHFTAEGAFDCEEATCSVPVPDEAPEGLLVETAGNGADLLFSWNPVAGAAGYHLLQSTDRSFAGEVELAGSTSGDTDFTLADGIGGTPDMTFFQVRAVNSCGQEGP
jgi:subtilisin-like proprotein convertase family protein